MSVTAFFAQKMGDLFKICGRYLIFLVKSRILWKMQPLFLLGPFMPLVWGQT